MNAWLLTLALGLVVIPPVASQDKDASTQPTTEPKAVELRGRVVCLAEEMHRRHGTELPTQHEHLWGFKDQEGRCYTLLRLKASEAIFLDEALRAKELLLKGKLFPQSLVLEVTSIHSFRQGKLQDIYYYCDICAIKSIAPEPCACCQGPVELIEQPATK